MVLVVSEVVYSQWPMNKMDFPKEGPNSFRECTEVAESLGCIVKLRGRSDSKRRRGNYLTIHGPQCLAVYDMFIGVARALDQDMSKVLLPHEALFAAYRSGARQSQCKS